MQLFGTSDTRTCNIVHVRWKTGLEKQWLKSLSLKMFQEFMLPARSCLHQFASLFWVPVLSMRSCHNNVPATHCVVLPTPKPDVTRFSLTTVDASWAVRGAECTPYFFLTAFLCKQTGKRCYCRFKNDCFLSLEEPNVCTCRLMEAKCRIRLI